MKANEKLKKIVFKNEKTKNINIVILSIIFSICILASVVYYSINHYIQDNYKKNISVRTLSVMVRDNKMDFSNFNKDKKTFMEKLEKLDHVIGAYESSNYELNGKIQNIEGYDGSVTIIGLNKESLISLFDVNEDFFDNSNNLVCPNNFIPDLYAESSKYKAKKTINIKSIINNKYDVIFDYEGKKEEQQFTIYKGYSSEKNYGYNNECYAYENDLTEIKEKLFEYEDSQITAIYLLIDDYKNVSSVTKELESMNYNVSRRFNIDATSVAFIYIICNILFLSAIVFGYNYLSTTIKKYLIKNNSMIALLAALGFKKEEILSLYKNKINLTILKSIIISLVVVTVGSFIANKKIFVWTYSLGFNLICFNYITIIFLLIIIIIINLIIKKTINEYYQQSIINSIKEIL